VTNPSRSAFSALAASGQTSMLIKVGNGVLPQVPIIWVKYYAPSALLVNKYAHPITPLTSKEHESLVEELAASTCDKARVSPCFARSE
jgi:hypothetical protein